MSTIAALLTLGSCRGDDEALVPSTDTTITAPRPDASVRGFYLLNEGNMGSNKATLDYMDYTTGEYHKNIYAERNPEVVMELGDVGNDIGIYGSKLYAVINCSHFVEVMDANTAKHKGKIDIPNCRYIAFSGSSAYVSSYAGPVLIDPNARLGYVARIDTATLQVTDTVNVGYQPEEMVISGNYLYVANSGGYRVPDYDRTVSVIDLSTFKVIKTIDVAINLHRMAIDRNGIIYISSRGDYYSVGSDICRIDSRTGKVLSPLGIPASDFCISGDSLYVYGSQYSKQTGEYTISYAIYDCGRGEKVGNGFIADGTEAEIKQPYGLSINPETHEILIADAGNYVSPGRLHCYDAAGRRLWSVTTGDIPAHFAFMK